MNNEEKILEILGQHGNMLERHGNMLEQQGNMLEQQGKLLDRQGEILEQQGKLLGTIQTDVADLKERVVKIEITQENIIIPNIQALAEGQANLLATLAPKNRVEALEDEMAFMKSVIKILSQEVAELRKAQ